MGGIEHIARHAVRAAHADQAGRELIQIGLAEQQRALIQQALHRGRRRRRTCRRNPDSAAVVGRPATSILSFTANGTPQNLRPSRPFGLQLTGPRQDRHRPAGG